MSSKRKTWQEKLADRDDLPKFLVLERRFPCFNAVHKMGAEVGDPVVLVNPGEIVECMKKVPYGKLTTIVEICKAIAQKYRVKGCCSLTAGIFITIAAHAVEEAKKEGKALDIPYWRTLKADGCLNDKFPGGAEAHQVLLENEGFKVVRAGKKLRVENYQAYLVNDPEAFLA